MKTENKDKYYFNKEQERLKGCRRGMLILIVGTIIFWGIVFTFIL